VVEEVQDLASEVVLHPGPMLVAAEAGYRGAGIPDYGEALVIRHRLPIGQHRRVGKS